ncbi:MAG: VOC family protein [Thermoanaerobaculia bacterium]
MPVKAQKITPFLWFDSNAEAAAEFYTSVFPNSKITRTTRYEKNGAAASGRPEGSVMTVVFELEGQEFVGINGGPHFRFTEAVSFVVNCDSQEEVDFYWEKLSAGGDESAQQCGWLKDRFGLSWQVVPRNLAQYVGNPDPAKADRAMKAILGMKKLDLERLRRIAEGEE